MNNVEQLLAALDLAKKAILHLCHNTVAEESYDSQMVKRALDAIHQCEGAIHE